MAIVPYFLVAATIAGLSVYTRTYDRVNYKLGWSYILGWCGACFQLAGLVLMIVRVELSDLDM